MNTSRLYVFNSATRHVSNLLVNTVKNFLKGSLPINSAHTLIVSIQSTLTPLQCCFVDGQEMWGDPVPGALCGVVLHKRFQLGSAKQRIPSSSFPLANLILLDVLTRRQLFSVFVGKRRLHRLERAGFNRIGNHLRAQRMDSPPNISASGAPVDLQRDCPRWSCAHG